MRKRFITFLALFLVCFTLVNILVVQKYHKSYPITPAPEFSDSIRPNILDRIAEIKPKVILLGDSALDAGVDEKLFTQYAGQNTYEIAIHGSTSALWYVLLKNCILNSENLPKTIIIFFRDTELTTPEYHVDGRFLQIIDEYAGSNEQNLLQKSYLNKLGSFMQFIYSRVPFLYDGNILSAKIEGTVRYKLLGRILGLAKDQIDQEQSMEFGEVIPAIYTANILNGVSELYTTSNLNFTQSIDRSYLPDMIEMARQKDVNLIFVRLHAQLFAGYTKEPGSLKNYMVNLAEYLAGRKFQLIDFSHEETLGDQLYSDPVHMNAEGREYFSSMAAASLKGFLH